MGTVLLSSLGKIEESSPRLHLKTFIGADIIELKVIKSAIMANAMGLLDGFL